MSEIACFTIKQASKEFEVKMKDESSLSFSIEYLRVFSPANNPKELVSHKKDVAISKIESVGKHGYRLIFDDGHNGIFNLNNFVSLNRQHDLNWKSYLDKINHSPHSREPMINFTEVK